MQPLSIGMRPLKGEGGGATKTSAGRSQEFADGFADVLALSLARPANVLLSRLKHAIETGVYAHGDQLPGERQLALNFGATRSTVRKVLYQLEQMKFITRRAGSGTFVSYAATERDDVAA